MNRSVLVLGGLVIIAMCLVPPFYTGPVDDVTDALSGEDVQRVEYHVIWQRPSLQEDSPLSNVQQWEIAWTRLLLQLLVVMLLTGGIAYYRKS